MNTIMSHLERPTSKVGNGWSIIMKTKIFSKKPTMHVTNMKSCKRMILRKHPLRYLKLVKNILNTTSRFQVS